MTPADLEKLLDGVMKTSDGPPWHAKRLTDGASIRTDRPHALPHEHNRLVALVARGVRENWELADFIVATVNALPALVALWKAAENHSIHVREEDGTCRLCSALAALKELP